MHPFDDTVPVNQDERPVRVTCLVDVGPLGLRDLPLRLEIGEKGRLDAEPVAEGRMSECRVDADADDVDFGFPQLRPDLLIRGKLVGADRTEVQRVENEQ